MRTVSVDVDLDDYVDEFLENASDKELKKELENRGYVIFKEKRHLRVKMDEPISFENPDDLKRHLCDIVDMGYYTSEDALIDSIKSRLR